MVAQLYKCPEDSLYVWIEGMDRCDRSETCLASSLCPYRKPKYRKDNFRIDYRIIFDNNAQRRSKNSAFLF